MTICLLCVILFKNAQEAKMKEIITIKGEKSGKEFKVDMGNVVQTRYEMIRECALSAQPAERICKKYGYFRQQYYLYKKRFEEKNWEGLVPQKKGPKSSTKMTEDLVSKILNLRFRDPGLDVYDIWNFLKEKGYQICVRSISLVLKKHGVTLKKTRKMSI